MEESQITRKCIYCKEVKQRSSFSSDKSRKNGFNYRCKECDKLLRQTGKHRARSNELKRSQHFKCKMKVLRYYGGDVPLCYCCKEPNVEFLAIDHTNNNGADHRREIGISGGYHFYRWLIKMNYPLGYRVLCHNCNMSIGIYGYCPHQPHENPVSLRMDPGNRVCRGSSNPMSILNEQQVAEIKKMLQSGVKQREIADKYGVKRGAIEHISCGRTWKHIIIS
jgi:hypothetical protein